MKISIFLALLSLIGTQDTINLSLQDAIRIALENNRDIQIVKKTVEISVGDIETQKGIFDPQIGLSSSYTDGEIPTVSSFIPSGTITQGEFLTQTGVIVADNALKAAEDNLKNILAISITQKIDATDEPTTVVKTYDESQTFNEALEKRPEVAQAKLDIESKETLKKFYSNQRLPSLSVQASVQLQGLGGSANPDRLSFEDGPEPIPPQFDEASDAFRQLAETDFPTFAVLGILSFPIFNWTAKGNYVKASADLDRSVITFKKVGDDVELDVSNAIRAIENSIKGINATKIAVELAEEVLRNEQERLNVGIGTTRNVLDAQRDLVDARFAQIQAIVDYNVALARLERAKGTILEAKGVKIKE